MKNAFRMTFRKDFATLLLCFAYVAVAMQAAPARGFGGGGFRGGGGGFDRGGFGGDFRGQGSISHASSAGFDRPPSGSLNRGSDGAGSFDRGTSTANQSQRQSAMGTDQQNRQNAATSNINSAEKTRTNNVNSAENTRTNDVNNYDNSTHNYYGDGYYGGGYYGGCDGCGWGAAAAGMVGGLAIGAAVASYPPYATTVYVNNAPYQYADGTFYAPAPSGGGYVVAAPPSGAAVKSLPQGYTTVYVPGSSAYYYYFNGYYYHWTGANYVVVTAPPGVTVPYLPQGATTVQKDGLTFYKWNNVLYTAKIVSGEVVYTAS